MLDEIKKLRKELHQHPKLSGQEKNTANRIKNFIELHNPTEITENVGGNGLLAVYRFSEGGTTIAIRCELDALPIEEANGFAHRSKVKGVSHKCGHDGHMAIVAGLIFWIKKQSFNSGKIVLLFQPAEETGIGALKVMNDDRFKNLNPDYIFSLHNIPGERINTIIATKNRFSAEVQSFALYLNGKEAHAAEPAHYINPADGISDIIQALSRLNQINPVKEDFSVLTAIHIKMGEKSYGISPGSGEIHYTIRTWSAESMNVLKNHIKEIVETNCLAHQLTYKIEWLEYFPACINDSNCMKYIVEAAQSNGYELIERTNPFRFGEDFGWYSKEYKTGMFGLGAGVNSPSLHQVDYDFADDVLETGITMFTSLIQRLI